MSVPTLDSLPPIPGGALNVMKREAEKKMAEEGITYIEEPVESDSIQESKIDESAEQVDQQESNQPIQKTEQESEQARNFKNLKLGKQKAERERDEALRLLRQIEEQRNAAPAEDLDFNLDPDEFAEGKHMAKVQKKIAAQEQRMQQYDSEIKALKINQQLVEQFDDWKKVMTVENINELEVREPEIAATILASSNPYTARITAYKFIKNLGIYKDSSMDQQRAQVNISKPRQLASVSSQQSNSPLTKVNAFDNGLTEELAKQLRAEMAAAIKRR